MVVYDSPHDQIRLFLLAIMCLGLPEALRETVESQSNPEWIQSMMNLSLFQVALSDKQEEVTVLHPPLFTTGRTALDSFLCLCTGYTRNVRVLESVQVSKQAAGHAGADIQRQRVSGQFMAAGPVFPRQGLVPGIVHDVVAHQ